MHEHHIAHRFVYKFVYHLHDQLTTRLSDCMTLNIMLDPHEMYPQLYHFVATHSTRDNRKDASQGVHMSATFSFLSHRM